MDEKKKKKEEKEKEKKKKRKKKKKKKEKEKVSPPNGLNPRGKSFRFVNKRKGSHSGKETR